MTKHALFIKALHTSKNASISNPFHRPKNNVLETSKNASNSKNYMCIPKSMYFKLPKILLINHVLPTSKNASNSNVFTNLCPANHTDTSNFQKCFYFQCSSPTYFHVKNRVLQTSKNTSNSSHFYRPMFSSPYCYTKLQKMLLLPILVICLSPSKKPCTSNFQKYFYFQSFSPTYFNLKNRVLQTSKNASNSNHFYRPMSSSPYCYSERLKILLFHVLQTSKNTSNSNPFDRVIPT